MPLRPQVGYKTHHDESDDDGVAIRHLAREDTAIGHTADKVFASLAGTDRLSRVWKEKAAHDEAYLEFIASQQQHAGDAPHTPRPPAEAQDTDGRSRRGRRSSVTAYTVDLYDGSFTRSATTGAVLGHHVSAGSSPFATEVVSRQSYVASSTSALLAGGSVGGGCGGRLPHLSPLGAVCRARTSLDLDAIRAVAPFAGAGVSSSTPAADGNGGKGADDVDDELSEAGDGGRECGFQGPSVARCLGTSVARLASAPQHSEGGAPLSSAPRSAVAAASSGGGAVRLPSLRPSSQSSSLQDYPALGQSQSRPPSGQLGGGIGIGGCSGRKSRRGSMVLRSEVEEGIALDIVEPTIVEDVGRWFDAGDLLYCNADCPEQMAAILGAAGT
ncbi:hypothetical protein GPECTOR_6g793 [Gonium pectorale]|uniref:Uncharacterized protein n=1 Tax=Gonium pectorale TaxID=33097 RepID=A0A150GVM2_GONPE|nr:hypothetical protein GPECTOR_6g793 [Gonium pectorale]|eukprot:KXZ53875.1 hypothetical protein GPECTOR_6g793 [Gonium pectorale]